MLVLDSKISAFESLLVFYEQIFRLGHRLELKIVPSRILEEHCILLTWKSFKP